MIFFTADLHFGHANVIKHCNRPFATVEEMDDALTHNWNQTVSPEDEVYILGDFTMKPAAVAHSYLSALNGKKYFIRGNHDHFLKKFEPFADDLVWIKDYHVLRQGPFAFILFHYPIAEWDGFFRGAIHLYGHVHNSETSQNRLSALSGKAINVGVDCHDFRPISLDEVVALAAKLP